VRREDIEMMRYCVMVVSLLLFAVGAMAQQTNEEPTNVDKIEAPSSSSRALASRPTAIAS
jgi:uncharacterized MAPEG superfamily protein